MRLFIFIFYALEDSRIFTDIESDCVQFRFLFFMHSNSSLLKKKKKSFHHVLNSIPFHVNLNQLSFPSTKIISTNYYSFQIHLLQGDKNIECQFGDRNIAYFTRSLIRNRVFNSKRFCLIPSTWRRIRKLLLLFIGGAFRCLSCDLRK